MPGRAFILHGHFYQPPRENPWLDYVEAEPTAAPFHDWNRRIERECYRAVVAARVPDAAGRIARIVNTLERISFDFGPTLLAWMEEEAPETYRAVLDADAASARRTGGFGNAIAAPYHHVILPLSSRRDKVTEVRWGIADFRRRFGREPVGMWLPETAVDDETLDVLAAHDIRFTILAPHQVKRAPAGGLPGRYRTGGGHEIALVVYDAPLSHEVAFGPLLEDAYGWARRITDAIAPGASPALVTLATDGETFGHHHRFGEMALARLLDILDQRPDVAATNPAAFLASHPPAEAVELVAPSSWSCPHGVERWRSDCGCRTAPERGWHQTWRAPLRAAVDWLAAELHGTFEREGGALFTDPWAARDAYGEVRDAPGAAIAELVTAQAGRALAPAETIRARELLELEHDALALFTSCAWFFDDIGGLEPLQALRYAAHAIELAGPRAAGLDSGFAQRLAAATSNDPQVGDGRRVYLERARPAVPQAARAAASFAALHRLSGGAATGRVGGYDASAGADRVRLVHRRTGLTAAFDVSVEASAGPQLAVAVTPAGQSAPARFALGGLTEPERAAITHSLVAAIAGRSLAPQESTSLCEGRATLGEVAERGLLARVQTLARDRSDSALAAALDLLDLLELAGGTVPFDVQTAFERVRGALGAAEAPRLALLAERLGFGAGS
jgi:hypothetical protein